MSNKKQSSIEFLEEALSIHFTHEQDMQFLGLFIQAKELHKKQLIEAYEQGAENEFTKGGVSCSDYYKENYETDN